MLNTTIEVTRGDTINIPIKYPMKVGPIYRAQLRKNPSAVNFLVLSIVDTSILVTSEQSETLTKDTYYIELEENDGGVISTVQLTACMVREDITRTYGSIIPPAWQTDESIEVAEIIARHSYIRKLDGSLVDIATIALNTVEATELANQAVIDLNNLVSVALGEIANDQIAIESNEALRVNEEALRVTAESERETAEVARELNTATAIADTVVAKDNANTATGLANTATTEANTARDEANSAAEYATNALSIAPHIFEGYANLPAGVETLIPGTSFTPVLNLRPVNVQVFCDTVGDGFMGLQTVAAKYVANGDNYDVYLTSPVDLMGAEITLLGALLNQNKDLDAHFIEMFSFSQHSNTTLNPTTEIVPTNTVDNVLTLDTTAWGSTKMFPAAVKYSNGKYGTILIKSFTATTAIADRNFIDNVVLISNFHNENLGQHLSNLGYYAMADHLFDYPRRYTLKRDIVKIVNPVNLTRVLTVFPSYNLVDSGGNVIFSYTTVNATGGVADGLALGINIANETLLPYMTNTLSFQISQSGAAGKGIESSFVSDYEGYLEIVLGTDLGWLGYGVLSLLKDGIEVYSQSFKGAATVSSIPHSEGNYMLKIVTADANTTKIMMSSIIFNRELIDETPLFTKFDKVLFVTDSWGSYPENFQTAVQRYDGSSAGGDCYLPARFRDRFVEIGGNEYNVKLAVRGGFTSEWAKYWLPTFIAEAKPTKIIFHFAINDYSSSPNMPSTASGFDFNPDPASKWGTLFANNGGVFGSCDKTGWKANLKYMSDYCISKKITPIFFMPPRTAALSQSQSGMAVYNNFILGGL